VASDPQRGSFSASSIADARLPDGRRVRCRIYWPAKADPPPYGATLTVQGSFRPLLDYQEFLFQQGVIGCQHNLLLLAESDDPGGLLLAGVLLGESGRLNGSAAGEAFRVTGLSHLIAVSGSHLAVIASLLTRLLKRLKLKTGWEVCLLALLVGGYVLLTALQPSALRSAGMLVIIQGSRLIGRRAHATSALCAVACLMIALAPATAFSLGFWLSVFAVFGMWVYQVLARAWLQYLAKLASDALRCNQPDSGSRARKLPRRLAKALRSLFTDPIALCLTAQACTLPLTVPVFASVSLICLPANLLVTPLFTLMLLVGLPLLTVGALLPPIQQIGIRALTLLAGITCRLAEALARLPWSSLPLDCELGVSIAAALLIGALIYRIWPLPQPGSWKKLARSLLAVALAVLVWANLPRPPELVMLDIGQGDAILVREGKSSLLLDTGPHPTELRRALARNHVNGLDALVISHLDSDHCGCIAALSGSVRPSHIYFAADLLSAQPGSTAIAAARNLVGDASLGELSAGDTIILSRHLSLTVLLPLQPVREGGNADCLVLSLDYDAEADGQPEVRVLLTGDAEADVLAAITRAYPDMYFDVLKVPHHGSAKSVTPALLDDLGCQLALISVGAGNSFGHPTQACLQTLDAAGCLVLRSDELGDVRLRFTAQGLVIDYAGMSPFWSL
ncbi:MAG: ComEC/Rec2 family competence protein, partial [Coriobacteriia bacterium]|nr:ComEC/Rec2 family competence protein [Coriobacteriia bacterium]